MLPAEYNYVTDIMDTGRLLDLHGTRSQPLLRWPHNVAQVEYLFESSGGVSL